MILISQPVGTDKDENVLSLFGISRWIANYIWFLENLTGYSSSKLERVAELVRTVSLRSWTCHS